MYVVINTPMVGISEELMFRGILFHGASSSFRIWRTAWITSIIFGARHVLNGFISGNFNASILQAFCVFMFGFYMVALRVRLGTIIPGIIIHWLWDCLASLTYFPGALTYFPGDMIVGVLISWCFSITVYGSFETTIKTYAVNIYSLS
jgi:membrane protease YdiL (CAAX protease family)